MEVDWPLPWDLHSTSRVLADVTVGGIAAPAEPMLIGARASPLDGPRGLVATGVRVAWGTGHPPFPCNLTFERSCRARRAARASRRVGASQRPMVIQPICDDTELVTRAQKRRSPHGAGFVSACQHSCFLVAGASLWVMRPKTLRVGQMVASGFAWCQSTLDL